jgi:acyl-CoA hydrolase
MIVKSYKSVSPEEAVKVVKSGDHIHFSSVASAPQCLIKALVERGRRKEFCDVHIHHLHTEGPAPYAEAEFEGIFQHDAFFVGGNVRCAVQSGYADYIPVFLSETQRLYREGYLPCDVAMIQVSPPDEHGYVSMGTSVDATLAAVEVAKTVIAVVNPNVPRAFGDALIPMEMIDIFVEDDTPLEPAHFNVPDEIETAIGKHCAELIEDGACLQLGIGAIPNAVLAQLGNHKNLGIHTEMFADGVLPLVERGVINGANKVTDRGKLVATFLMGSQKVYDFIHNNPQVLMMDVGYTNDPFVIAKNPKVTAINSALQIDLTGQVGADSLGTKHYSGVGGQVDFIYGASRSQGGKAIIAMPSITPKGISKICPTLIPGSGVVSTRAHVHWVVTEYGAVNLYGKSLQERARLLISIAHPMHQESLEKAAFERFGPHFHYISKKTLAMSSKY